MVDFGHSNPPIRKKPRPVKYLAATPISNDSIFGFQRFVCDAGLLGFEDPFIHLDGILAEVSVLYSLELGAASLHERGLWKRIVSIRAF